MLFANKKACQLLGWDRKTQTDDKSTGHLGFVPGADESYYWRLDALVAGLFYLDQRKAGLTVKLAGQAATRLRTGMREHPAADQLTITTLENGAVSVLPTASLDLSTGYLSGGYLLTALTVDARNLRLRVQRLIEADAAIIGGEDA